MPWRDSATTGAAQGVGAICGFAGFAGVLGKVGGIITPAEMVGTLRFAHPTEPSPTRSLPQAESRSRKPFWLLKMSAVNDGDGRDLIVWKKNFCLPNP
jgi:hypothetical protein